MPNWCTTHAVFSGKKEDIARLAMVLRSTREPTSPIMYASILLRQGLSTDQINKRMAIEAQSLLEALEYKPSQTAHKIARADAYPNKPLDAQTLPSNPEVIAALSDLYQHHESLRARNVVDPWTAPLEELDGVDGNCKVNLVESIPMLLDANFVPDELSSAILFDMVGTRKYGGDGSIAAITDTALEVSVDTPWTPPTAGLIQMAKRLNLSIALVAREPGNGIQHATGFAPHATEKSVPIFRIPDVDSLMKKNEQYDDDPENEPEMIFDEYAALDLVSETVSDAVDRKVSVSEALLAKFDELESGTSPLTPVWG